MPLMQGEATSMRVAAAASGGPAACWGASSCMSSAPAAIGIQAASSRNKRNTCAPPATDNFTGPFFSAARYSAPFCRYEALAGSDVTASLGGGTLRFTLQRTAEVRALS